VTPRRILAAYRWLFAALIIAASAQTLIAEHAHHALLLASAEIVGALFFVCWRTELRGAGLLLAVFTVAQAIAMLGNRWSIHLIQYAASTAMIVLLGRALERAVPRMEGARSSDSAAGA
jgi:hypothetical protein